ncbi:MAG: hypothetical protein ABI858_00485, partial [Pseudoxanthomonas sp.]
MSKIIKQSLTLIILLLATTAAIAQVPVLKKPLVPAPQIKPSVPPAVLKTPITVVNAAGIASNSPNREEAARRLKAQNVPVAAALPAIRNAFGVENGAEGRALRAAGYGTADLLLAIKQADGLDAAAMSNRMRVIGIPLQEKGPALRRLYGLDFDALLAAMSENGNSSTVFGYALDAMDYNLEQILQTGYRYFSGGFIPNHRTGHPYPGPGDLYDLITTGIPLAGRIQVDHYMLYARLMETGYGPALTWAQVRLGTYSSNGAPADSVSRCLVSTNFREDTPQDQLINPVVRVEIAPGGVASHSEAHRRCYVDFLERLRANRVTHAFASQIANDAVYCAPDTNPACAVETAKVAKQMVNEAGYPEQKRRDWGSLEKQV